MLLWAMVNAAAWVGIASQWSVLCHAEQKGSIDFPKKCETLLTVLEIYDSSVRSIVWEQVLYQPKDNAVWSPIESMLAGFDEEQRWFCQSESVMTSPDDPDLQTSRTYSFVDKMGERVFASEPTKLRGKVAAPENSVWISTTPLHLLGRSVDFITHRPVSSVLRTAKSLAYQDPSLEFPWPGLRGTVAIGGKEYDLLVRIDIDLGGAPRFILLNDAEVDAPIVTVESTSFQSIRGINIPICGVRTTYAYFRDQDKQQLALVDASFSHREESLQLNGIPGMPASLADRLRGAVARGFQRARAGRDNDLWYVPIGTASVHRYGTPEVCRSHIHELNFPLSDGRFQLPLPDDATLADFFHNKRLPWKTSLTFPSLIPAKTAAEHGSLEGKP